MLGAVETGRYRTPKVPLGERVCKCCNNDKVETEFHFVMECSKLYTKLAKCAVLYYNRKRPYFYALQYN